MRKNPEVVETELNAGQQHLRPEDIEPPDADFEIVRSPHYRVVAAPHQSHRADVSPHGVLYVRVRPKVEIIVPEKECDRHKRETAPVGERMAPSHDEVEKLVAPSVQHESQHPAANKN